MSGVPEFFVGVAFGILVNLLLHKKTDYIEELKNQTKILYEMFKTAQALHTTPATAALLSDFLEKVSNEYHKDNDVKALLEELALIHDKLKNNADKWAAFCISDCVLNLRRNFIKLHIQSVTLKCVCKQCQFMMAFCKRY